MSRPDLGEVLDSGTDLSGLAERSPSRPGWVWKQGGELRPRFYQSCFESVPGFGGGLINLCRWKIRSGSSVILRVDVFIQVVELSRF